MALTNKELAIRKSIEDYLELYQYVINIFSVKTTKVLFNITSRGQQLVVIINIGTELITHENCYSTMGVIRRYTTLFVYWKC